MIVYRKALMANLLKVTNIIVRLTEAFSIYIAGTLALWQNRAISKFRRAIWKWLLRQFYTLQRYLLDYLNHFHTGRVSPQLGCGNTCQIWTWYSIGHRCFGKSGKQRNGGNPFSNSHPRYHSINQRQKKPNPPKKQKTKQNKTKQKTETTKTNKKNPHWCQDNPFKIIFDI